MSRRVAGSFGGTPRIPIVLALALLPLLLFSSNGAEGRAEPAPALVSSAQVRALSPEEAGRAIPVRLSAVVTYCDPGKTTFYVSDDAGGLLVHRGEEELDLRPGDWVELQGVTQAGSFRPGLRGTLCRVVHRGGLPEPRVSTYEELATGDYHGQWVEVEGVFQSSPVSGQGVVFFLTAGEHRMELLVDHTASVPADHWAGARVRVRGVCQIQLDPATQAHSVQLLLPSLANVALGEAASAGAFDAPARRIHVLHPARGKSWVGERVRVLGAVTEFLGDGSFILRDGTGSLRITTAQRLSLRKGAVIEAVGHLVLVEERLVLQDCIYRRIGFFDSRRIEEYEKRIQAGDEEPDPVFTNIHPIRRIGRAEAGRRHSVRIRGVIIYYDAPDRLYLHGGRETIFVDAGGQELDLQIGQEVILNGETAPGTFSPIIANPRFRILSSGFLPEAVVMGLDEVRTGGKDSQWVELKGVVQGLESKPPRLVMEIATAGGRFEATVLKVASGEPLAFWIDSEIRVRGVCQTLHNSAGQVTGIRLLVPGVQALQITQAAPSDPWALPRRSIGELGQFDPDGSWRHRVKIQGVVTHSETDDSFFLQDESGAVQVRLRESAEVSMGQEVIVTGFLDTLAPARALHGAEVRIEGLGALPDARSIVADQLAGGAHANELVAVSGWVIEQFAEEGDQILSLRSGGHFFDAILDESSNVLRPVTPGSLVEITGVAAPQLDASVPFVPFMVLMRTAEDLKVLKKASWWNARRALWLFGGMGGAVSAGLIWVWLLRRQVARQTAIIQCQFDQEKSLQQRYRSLFEDANDTVYSHDLDGRFTDLNPAGQRLLGYTREEFLQLTVSQVVAPDQMERVERAMEQKRAAQTASIYELDLVAKDGRRLTVEISSRPILHEGRLVGVHGIAREITARKQAEAHRLSMERKLQEAQKLESLGVMAGGIAHDFNNLLTVIIGNASLAKSQLDPDSELSGLMTSIEQGSMQAADLCKQMLAYSGRGQFVIHPVNFTGVISDMSSLLAATISKKIELKMALKSPLPPVLADEAQLQQVALNLVINAAEAIGDDSGTIEVSTGVIELKTDSLEENWSQALKAGLHVLLEVADSGCGMSESVRARIFDPFFTTKFTGRGLGLAAVRGIVHGHGGALKVLSEPGKGSRFQVALPAAQDAVVEPPLELPVPPALSKQGKVLVVDDEAHVRQVTRRILESLGFEVALASNGQTGLELFRRQAGELQLVLLDLTMPDLSGLETLREMKSIKPDARVILMSGYSEEGAFANFKDLGLAGFIGKPFKPEDLQRQVFAALSEQPVSV